MPAACHLYYATNIISRSNKLPEQQLNFYFKVPLNQTAPTIEVHWAGEDGVWHTTPAGYFAAAEAGWVIWRAEAKQSLADGALPGNVQFACKYSVNGQVTWENAQGQNHRLESDSGLWAQTKQVTLINLAHRPSLAPRPKQLPFTIALHQPTLKPQRVFVRWTGDNWRTTQEADLTLDPRYWDTLAQSNARNPNQYGWGVWQGVARLRGKLDRIEYSIGCETATGTIWDNNQGVNYAAQRPQLKVLTLNLHCYQEEDQAAKFAQIVKAIREQNIDVVCLQEVAEPWNNGAGDWAANAGNILQQQLGAGYTLYTDWAHIGFDRYREGVAVLSRWPLLSQQATYLSSDTNIRSIHARKAVLAGIDTPQGRINIIATHLSWWEDGFQTQFNTLHQWAAQHQTPEVVATLIGGDFNIPRNGPGHTYVLSFGDWQDAFNVAAKTDADERIDYIWLMGAALKATAARTLFSPADYGPVSDHLGYCVTFGPGQLPEVRGGLRPIEDGQNPPQPS